MNPKIDQVVKDTILLAKELVEGRISQEQYEGLVSASIYFNLANKS